MSTIINARSPYFLKFPALSGTMTSATFNIKIYDGFLLGKEVVEFAANKSVIKLIEMAITSAKKANKYVGICGQGPSDHPDFAEWLVKQGITSLSLNPDTVVNTWKQLSKK